MTGSEHATVLVVDDEPEVADAYSAQLSPRYEVRTAYGGTAALEALDEDVDVVMLDRKMPDISGDDVLAEIRERELSTRVAMVTAVEPDFDIIDMPFDDYVVKPVSETNLFDTIERLLTCSSYERQLRRYYALTSKYAALQASKSPGELATNEEFQELEAKLQRHRDRLDEMVRSFDEDDFEVVLRDFDGPEPGRSQAE